MVVPDSQHTALKPLRWRAAAATDRGRKRRRNEDAVLLSPDTRTYAVADGMGGHAAGNVASRLAVEVLASAFPRAPSPRILPPALGRRLIAAFEAANGMILDHAAARPAHAGMGTTLTVLAPVVAAPRCVIAHIGDSRAYRLRGSELKQLTRDHTWVQQQVQTGMLTPAEARHHPLSSVLSRVLGTPAAGPPDIYVSDAEPGDLYLLCSDGLTNMLDDAELTGILSQRLAPDETVGALIDAANARGGLDNITALLAAVEAA